MGNTPTAAHKENTGVIAPQQRRSRESFGRVKAATLEILIEKGPTGVTIADVAERAGVSVGSIYLRVGNRASLLQVVQQEELERLRESMVNRMSALPAGASAEARVNSVVSTFLSEMVDSARVTAALVSLSGLGEEFASAGPATWRLIKASVCAALQRVNPESPLSAARAEWLFEMIYATTYHRLINSSGTSGAVETGGLLAWQTATVAALLGIWDRDLN